MSGTPKRKRPTLAEVRRLKAEIAEANLTFDKLRRDNMSLIGQRDEASAAHRADLDAIAYHAGIKPVIRLSTHTAGPVAEIVAVLRRRAAERDEALRKADGLRENAAMVEKAADALRVALCEIREALGIKEDGDAKRAVLYEIEALRKSREGARAERDRALEDLAAARSQAGAEHDRAQQAWADLRRVEREREDYLKLAKRWKARAQRIEVGLYAAGAAIKLATTDANGRDIDEQDGGTK